MAKKLMDKCKCPEQSKNPEEAHQLLDKCKTPWVLPRCYSIMHTKMPRLWFMLQRPRDFSQDPMYIMLLKEDSNPGEVS